MRANTPSVKILHLLLAVAFVFNLISPVLAQEVDLKLPPPSKITAISKPFAPAIIRAVTVNPNDPFLFDFIIDKGDSNLEPQAFEDETQKLVKYFLAALTIPENDLWVNLSPYEQDSMVPRVLGVTELGKDLLIEDYYLKQVTASLTNPNTETGKKFWTLAYAKAQELYGTTKVPINTFSKVWIVPDQAVVLEKDGSAFIADSHLKVFLDQDYVAIKKNLDNKEIGTDKIGNDKAQDINGFSAQIIKEVVLPEIEKEVNTGENFATVRQIYSSAILAAWYKKRLKESLLGRLYADQNKVAGVNAEDMDSGDKIFEKYTAALKTGAYNIIKQDFDLSTQKIVQRKYFSGGVKLAVSPAITYTQVGAATSANLTPPAQFQMTKIAQAIANIGNTGTPSASSNIVVASVRLGTTSQGINRAVEAKVSTAPTDNKGATGALVAVSQAVFSNSSGNPSSIDRAGSYLLGAGSVEIKGILRKTGEISQTRGLTEGEQQTAIESLVKIMNNPRTSEKPKTRTELAAKLNNLVKTGTLTGDQAVFAIDTMTLLAGTFDAKVNTLTALTNPNLSAQTLAGALSAGGVANAQEVASEFISLRTAQPLNATESVTAQIARSNPLLAQQLNSAAANPQVQSAVASYTTSEDAQSLPQWKSEATVEQIAGNMYAAAQVAPQKQQSEIKTILGGEISRDTIKVLISQAPQIDITGNANKIAENAKKSPESAKLYALLQVPAIRNAVFASTGQSAASSVATPVQNILASVSGIGVDTTTNTPVVPENHSLVTYFKAIANSTNNINAVALVRTIAAASNAAKADIKFAEALSSARNADEFKTVIQEYAYAHPEFSAQATPAGMESLNQLSDSQIRKVGGIDLSAERMDLKIKRDGNGVVLPVADQDLQNLKIDGLSPVILDVQPATPASVPFLMNLANTAQAK